METELNLRRSAAIGGLLFLVAVSIRFFLAQDASIALAAITLALIGGACIGFGARSDNLRTMAMEHLVACLSDQAAFAGVLWRGSARPLGVALYAVRDRMHHTPSFSAGMPRWYIPLWVVYDFAAALVLVALYAF